MKSKEKKIEQIMHLLLICSVELFFIFHQKSFKIRLRGQYILSICDSTLEKINQCSSPMNGHRIIELHLNIISQPFIFEIVLSVIGSLGRLPSYDRGGIAKISLHTLTLTLQKSHECGLDTI